MLFTTGELKSSKSVAKLFNSYPSMLTHWPLSVSYRAVCVHFCMYVADKSLPCQNCAELLLGQLTESI